MTQEDSRNVPDYAHARTKRQKQRAAGLHPDYWYPVLWSQRAGLGAGAGGGLPGEGLLPSTEDRTGVVARALENRCAHRQLKLSLGQVEGCRLSCSYHGWKYDESGRCVLIEHSLFGHKMPNARVEAFPVQERYGVIWVFPGDPAVASSRALPEIPEWADDSGWGKLSIDFTWKAHHSIIIDNTCDFTHAYLHRVRKPFTHAELTNLATDGDQVSLAYDTQVGQGPISKFFVNRKTTNTNAMKLGYAYPYQWSSTDEKIKHWCFVLPIAPAVPRGSSSSSTSAPRCLGKIPLLPVLPPRPAIRPPSCRSSSGCS